jgi:hypothetical protein
LLPLADDDESATNLTAEIEKFRRAESASKHSSSQDDNQEEESQDESTDN